MRQAIDNQREIYSTQAEQYERLISREDYQGKLLSVLEGITSFAGLDAVELGAGTGRLTRLLAPRAKSMYAFDLSAHMLAVAAAGLRASPALSWGLAVADHRSLPLPSRTADVVISGWSVCYLVTWNPDEWRPQLDRALDEMLRVLRPGGKIILLETLGTGFETPHPPENLVEYYRYLGEKGFSSTWLRTDYRFASLAEAEELAGFFFGEELRRKVAEQGWVILPECTGIWWREKV